MKRHIQKTGVRKFFGQDFVDMQAEPLKVLDTFFAAYGACIIEGCAITSVDGGTFDVAPGLVALECTDPESDVVAIRTMPFAGVQGVALPLYLAPEWTPIERVYGDGKVKPVAYDLSAVASGVAPEAPHLVLTAAGGHRFVDVLQDPTHRFVTDTERSKWNAILQQAKEYAAAQAASAQSTAVGVAKAHTDTTAAAVRDELALGDQTALNTAKAYADRIVAALVDGSPELLNTLEELAAALGGDPNFATTVMTAIGERVKTTDFVAHTASPTHVTSAERSVWDSKADPSNPGIAVRRTWIDSNSDQTFGGWLDQTTANRPAPYTQGFTLRTAPNGGAIQLAAGMLVESYAIRSSFSETTTDYNPWRVLYHSGNINPGREGDTVLSGEASAVVFENTGEGEIGSRRASLLLKWYDQFAGVSVLRGGGRDVQGLGININNEIVAKFLREGLMIGPHTAYHSGNLKIIRGSVDARGGNGGGNAYGVGGVYGEPAVVRVTHNLNTTAYSAQATAVSNAADVYSDNLVTVWRKGANYTDFVVTGGSNNRELCAFDYMIIPY